MSELKTGLTSFLSNCC